MKVSVILCTYNPSPVFFTRTIEGLQKQDLPLHEWELLIIDNKSSTDISKIAGIDWHPQSRIIREETPGLTNARLCGITHSAGDILVFVDDDNVLKNNYLTKAWEIGVQYPYLGAWGGKTIGEYESSPPAWFEKRHFEMLAIRDVERDVWSNQYFNWETTPIGAGLVIRREIGEAYKRETEKKSNQIVLDRSGNSLLSGGDNEIVYESIRLGYGTGRFRDLELWHLIPARRLDLNYIKELVLNISKSNVLLYHKFNRHYDPFPEVKGILSRLIALKWFYSKPRIKRELITAEKKGVVEGRKILKNLEHE